MGGRFRKIPIGRLQGDPFLFGAFSLIPTKNTNPNKKGGEINENY